MFCLFSGASTIIPAGEQPGLCTVGYGIWFLVPAVAAALIGELAAGLNQDRFFIPISPRMPCTVRI
jgi:hypothetical protein